MNPPNVRETIMLKRTMFNDSELSLEDKSEDLEYAIYGKLENHDVLRSAEKVELQEQWEYRTHDKDGKPSGTLRSRMVDEGEKY